MLQASSYPSKVFAVIICSYSCSQFYLRGRCVLAVVLKYNFSAQPQLGYVELRQVQAKTIETVKIFWPPVQHKQSAAINPVILYDRH